MSANNEPVIAPQLAESEISPPCELISITDNYCDDLSSITSEPIYLRVHHPLHCIKELIRVFVNLWKSGDWTDLQLKKELNDLFKEKATYNFFLQHIKESSNFYRMNKELSIVKLLHPLVKSILEVSQIPDVHFFVMITFNFSLSFSFTQSGQYLDAITMHDYPITASPLPTLPIPTVVVRQYATPVIATTPFTAQDAPPAPAVVAPMGIVEVDPIPPTPSPPAVDIIVPVEAEVKSLQLYI